MSSAPRGVGVASRGWQDPAGAVDGGGAGQGPAAWPRAGSALASDAEREQLALAFARDTVAACWHAPASTRSVVGDLGPARRRGPRRTRVVLTEEPARRGAERRAHARCGAAAGARPAAGVVALCADLPALRPAELADALHQAATHARAFVADDAGTGTTLLTAGPGQLLDPRFGAGSAAAHRLSGAVPIAGSLPSVRRDVDSPEDLDAAVVLGVGAWTSAALGLH